MSVLITGAGGFLGAHLVRRFAEALPGTLIAAADRDPPCAAVLDFWAGCPDVGPHALDVTDPAAVQALCEAVRPRLLIHAAAVTPDAATEADAPARILAVNAGGTAEVLRAALARPELERAIILSSGAVYGHAPNLADPVPEDSAPDAGTLYAVSKLAAEGIARRLGALAGRSCLAVRLPALYGEMERPTRDRRRPSEIHALTAALREGRPVATTRSTARRDWTHADDAAEAILALALAGPLRHAVYNAGSGVALSWSETLAVFASHGLVLDPNAETRLPPPVDRPALSIARLQTETGFRPRRSLGAFLAQHAVPA